MPKSHAPGIVEVGGQTFAANVLPDVFDSRDLEYRPRLQPLPPWKDARPDVHFVLTQQGNSCTGHAVAAMINTVLASGPDPIRVSPYMLYHLARRYDEFEGTDDEGSSLRGAFKGWFYHGVLPEEKWPSLEDEIDIDLDPDLARLAMRYPLGAFYRVNAFRLDDMQSAITELHAITASALVHSGWIEPKRTVREDGSVIYLIERAEDVNQLGGHAFTIVGYNDVGFLVQNSWGEAWGSKGFATLTYEDWLLSAFDAWVARPGVPSVVNLHAKTKIVTTTSGGVSQGAGPNLENLKNYVVNLANEGRLSTKGRFISTPTQIERVFQQMKETHDNWRKASTSDGGEPEPRRVVIYAHGGLVGEEAGLNVAQAQLNWWLNNGIYPISFAWQSGAVETLISNLSDIIRGELPFGGIGFDLVEQADRLVERISRSRLSWMWTEMKENAAAASKPLPAKAAWPPDGSADGKAMAGMPGASLVVDRLRIYAESVGGQLEVHLVGHSAGSIFTAHLLPRLAEAGIPVASVSWLAPAITIADFKKWAIPQLQAKNVKRFAVFGLSDALELDDVVGKGRINIYQKSLLYLVSHALEGGPNAKIGETPLLGMQRHAVQAGLARALKDLNGELIWAPSEASDTSRCSATTHGGMDGDTPTMTSVMLRILGRASSSAQNTFRPHASRGLQPAGAPAPQRPDDAQLVNVEPRGEVPVTQMGSSGSAET